MMATQDDITVIENNDPLIHLWMYEVMTVNGVPTKVGYDIAGATFACYIKQDPYSPDPASVGTFTVTDAANGYVDLQLLKTHLPTAPAQYWYRIDVTKNSKTVTARMGAFVVINA